MLHRLTCNTLLPFSEKSILLSSILCQAVFNITGRAGTRLAKLKRVGGQTAHALVGFAMWSVNALSLSFHVCRFAHIATALFSTRLYCILLYLLYSLHVTIHVCPKYPVFSSIRVNFVMYKFFSINAFVLRYLALHYLSALVLRYLHTI